MMLAVSARAVDMVAVTKSTVGYKSMFVPQSLSGYALTVQHPEGSTTHLAVIPRYRYQVACCAVLPLPLVEPWLRPGDLNCNNRFDGSCCCTRLGWCPRAFHQALQDIAAPANGMREPSAAGGGTFATSNHSGATSHPRHALQVSTPFCLLWPDPANVLPNAAAPQPHRAQERTMRRLAYEWGPIRIRFRRIAAGRANLLMAPTCDACQQNGATVK